MNVSVFDQLNVIYTAFDWWKIGDISTPNVSNITRELRYRVRLTLACIIWKSVPLEFTFDDWQTESRFKEYKSSIIYKWRNVDVNAKRRNKLRISEGSVFCNESSQKITIAFNDIHVINFSTLTHTEVAFFNDKRPFSTRLWRLVYRACTQVDSTRHNRWIPYHIWTYMYVMYMYNICKAYMYAVYKTI